MFEVEDNAGSVILKQEFNVELVNGDYPFCSGISEGGQILAMQRQRGKIDLLDTKTGELIRTMEGDFLKLNSICFVDNDKTLVTGTRYGSLPILFFDVETGERIIHKGLENPKIRETPDNIAFSPDKTKLVQKNGSDIYVYDYINKKRLYTFQLEHCVKTAELNFLDNNTLGVRTDYGCFSLYNLKS